jgi:hypothetical protein
LSDDVWAIEPLNAVSMPLPPSMVSQLPVSESLPPSPDGVVLGGAGEYVVEVVADDHGATSFVHGDRLDIDPGTGGLHLHDVAVVMVGVARVSTSALP